MARSIRYLLATLAAIAVLALTACSGVQPDRDATGVITESADGADIFAIEVGDCTGDLTTGEVTELDVIPCTDPHGSEAYASVEMDDGDYPGTEAIDAQSAEVCIAEFEAFVGLPYEESALITTPLTPTVESWAGGDRQILCFVYDDGVQTTGSLANANR